MSGDKRLKIHIGGKCHLASNVTCLLVVKCLWRQLSQPLTGVRGPASKVWATNILGVKQLDPVSGYISSLKNNLCLKISLIPFGFFLIMRWQDWSSSPPNIYYKTWKTFTVILFYMSRKWYCFEHNTTKLFLYILSTYYILEK